jgi:hypothetical protein
MNQLITGIKILHKKYLGWLEKSKFD